jgi:Zn-finger domain-containing protein
MWERDDLDNADCYVVSDFKKKFGMIIRAKVKKCIHLSKKIINNEDYKLFSNDPDRKK